LIDLLIDIVMQMVLVSSQRKVANVSTVGRLQHLSGGVMAPDTTCATPADSTRRSTAPTVHCRNCSRKRYTSKLSILLRLDRAITSAFTLQFQPIYIVRWS